jgi:hypothetical protein
MNIQGGALEFDVLFKNGQINSALEETKKRVQGFSNAIFASGEQMEAAYRSAQEQIDKVANTIIEATKANEQAIANMSQKIAELKAEAYNTNDGDKRMKINFDISDLENKLRTLKGVKNELQEQEKAIGDYNISLNKQKEKADNAANAQVRFRTQLMNVKQQMMELGPRTAENAAQFDKLTAEATRLQTAMTIANTQVKNLANPNLTFQGILSGISGVTGAFTVAQGAIGLFGDKNEDLQKIMLKVQSLMAITMGLQQINNTLLSTSAFRLGVVAKAQAWWATVTTKANVVTAAGTVANIGLAGSFRLIGAAISSIPVFGWIVAGISALIAVVTHFSSKAKEAKKAAEEFYKSVAENASKPISEINKLAHSWNKLGDDLQAKEKFIKDNKKSFDELGISVSGVVDAENLLSNPAHVQNFINAQIAKAKAMATLQKSEKDVKDLIEAEQKLEAAKSTPKIQQVQYAGIYQAGSKEIDNPEIAKWEKKTAELNKKIQTNYETAVKYEKEGSEALEDAGVSSIHEYVKGTIGALEQAISEQKDKLKDISDPQKYKEVEKNISDIQKQIDVITGGSKKTTKDKKEKDPLTKDLEDKKKSYQEYFKWVNAGYQNEAKQEFSALLQGGKSYLDYLKKMREDTSLTKEQIHQITTEIAAETDKTILGEFENSLQEQLNNAQTVLDMINVIKNQREELAKSTEDDPLKEQKEKVITKQEEDVVKKQEETTKQLIADYSDYTDKVIMLELELTSDLQLLEDKRAKATTETDKKAIEAVINNRKQQYNEDKANLLSAGYEAMRKLIDLGQDKALLNISNKAFTWEADRTNAMLEVQKQAAQRVLEEMQRMQKEAPTDQIAIEIEEIKLKIEELNAELAKMPNEKFQEMLSGLQKITGALGNLDGEIGDIFSSISSEIGNLKVAFDETASTTDKISAGIAGIVDIINMVSSASAERKRVEKEFYQNQIALVHEYALALNEQLRLQSELAGSAFVNDYAGRLESGFNALSDATKNYQEALGKLSEGKAKIDLRNGIDWGNVGKGAGAGASAGAAIGSIVPVIGTAVGAVVGGIVGGLVGLFGGKKKKETFGGLLEVFPELVDSTGNLNKELAQTLIDTKQIDDNTSQLIQNALDWADAIEESNKQIKEVVTDLAGDLGNSIKTAMIDAWKAGEDGSKRMFEAASKSLENFIENLLYSTIFADLFAEFADRLAESLSPTGDGDVIDDYDYLMDELDKRDDLYLASLEAIQNRATQRGYDLWTPDKDENKPTSLSGAIKGASQEEINLLTGTTNAVRMNQVEGIEIMRNSLIQLTMISANTSTANKHLEQIEKNTNNIPYDPLRAQGITG